MTEPTDIVPDPMDALLGPPTPSGAEEALRRRLLARTTGALRRRRRLRLAVWAAALVTCYAAGGLTMYWFAPQKVQIVKVKESPASAPAPQPSPTPPAAEPPSAIALEWKAFDADGSRPDLYRQAGDQYARSDDPVSAVRCYGQSLDGASDKDLSISPNDDYLLMILKQARQKEKDDAKKHD